MKFRYKTILFDADGTLLDFQAAQESAFFESCRSFKITADKNTLARYDKVNHDLWQRLERGEITREQLFATRFPAFFESEGITGINSDAFNLCYRAALGHGGQLIDGAKELLGALSEHFELNMITNGVAQTQHERLELSGIHKFFSHIIISEEIKAEKPSRKFFEAACDICRISDKTAVLAVGDSLIADIAGASGFGFDTCWFCPEKLSPPPDIRPTYTISDLSELKNILL